MNVAVVGTGYVGLVSGACFAEMGVHVSCVDIDTKKIEGLKNGQIPIYEPGLDELVKRNVNEGRLNFTTSLAEVIDDVELVFSEGVWPEHQALHRACDKVHCSCGNGTEGEGRDRGGIGKKRGRHTFRRSIQS